MKSFLLIVAALTPLCARAQPATIEDRMLSYGCEDTIVVGRIRNGDYAPVHDEEDIIGHSWIDAQIKVKRVVRGARQPSWLPIRYFAHTHIRDDRDFMFVLSGDSVAGFEIKQAQLMAVRPMIRANCER